MAHIRQADIPNGPDELCSIVAQNYSFVQRVPKMKHSVAKKGKDADGANPSADSALLDVRGPISTITFNRPDRLNALNFALIDRVQQFFDFIEATTVVSRS